jgi:Helix-turn-helix domain
MATNLEREPFVDAEEAGKFLCLRPRRVLELARRGLIPAYALGDGQRRLWRFRLSELASALCSRGVHCADAAVRAKEKS